MKLQREQEDTGHPGLVGSSEIAMKALLINYVIRRNVIQMLHRELLVDILE